jgi:tRNA/rRNA methyltransferase
MNQKALSNIAIILVRTKYPGNLGAAARAMNNMGLSRLHVVAPQCEINEEAQRMAKSGKKILARAKTFRSLKSALRGMHLVIGTSAKTGGKRTYGAPLKALAPRILAQAAKQRVGIIFGPEDTGLTDDDLIFCHRLLRIPTHARARSVNLAQAVMLVGYELFAGQRPQNPDRVARLASASQVEAMYGQLEAALGNIGFLHPQNARHMMFAMRRLLGRAGLETEDVGILRGIARQIAWYAKNGPAREGR